jgi:erythromycin esterase
VNKTLIIFLILISHSIFSQEYLNLDFEYTIQGTEHPEKWITGNLPYKISIDTIEKIHFTKSLKIECNTYKENSFGFSSIEFPSEYVRGKSIEFKGKIKTDNVINGYAGLWLTARNDDGIQAFDNMKQRGITNSTDWTKVSIKLNIDKSVSNITFGSLLTGQGKAWFDNLEIFVDGEKFKDIKPKYLEPSKEELNWLKQHIYPLKTFEPNSNFDDDLEILNQLIGNSSVVALGENTHGSSEIFKMKQRIIKYLAQKKDFDIFSSEANMPDAYKLNDYIIDDIGNPIELLKDLKFFIWSTQEVLDMIEWMKQFNKSNQKILFTGFDMQFYYGAIKELERCFKNKDKSLKLISELKNALNSINNKSIKTQQIPKADKINIFHIINSIKNNVSKLKNNKDWLFQNIRLIEQYLNNNVDSRDKYMAENLLWIRKQNPKSKIVIWAHNDHIKKTGNVMGRYILDSIKKEYLSIGFTFHKGSYTAVGKNGLTSYNAQQSTSGTYEYIFNQINEPYFLLDLRQVKKQNSKYSKWLLNKLGFRDVGALKTVNEFYDTDLTQDFDFIIFINESSNSKLLD